MSFTTIIRHAEYSTELQIRGNEGAQADYFLVGAFILGVMAFFILAAVGFGCVSLYRERHDPYSLTGSWFGGTPQEVFCEREEPPTLADDTVKLVTDAIVMALGGARLVRSRRSCSSSDRRSVTASPAR